MARHLEKASDGNDKSKKRCTVANRPKEINVVVKTGRVEKATPSPKSPRKTSATFPLENLRVTMNDNPINEKRGFRFMDLPAEIRNRIYDYCLPFSEQLPLCHRPHLRALRHRTRLATHVDPYFENMRLPTNRQWIALAQVGAQVRSEFHGLYLESQEVGLCMLDVGKYLDAFYNLGTLTREQYHEWKWPFHGNITIAIPYKFDAREANGVEILPFMEVWAKSISFNAGFGRLVEPGSYDAATDCESKDFYRLLGCRVLPDDSPRSQPWLHLLRNRHLDSVTVHRCPTLDRRPYFHILFKPSHAESWMTRHDSRVPTGWLEEHGFESMEFFEVKIGVDRHGYSARAKGRQVQKHLHE